MDASGSLQDLSVLPNNENQENLNDEIGCLTNDNNGTVLDGSHSESDVEIKKTLDQYWHKELICLILLDILPVSSIYLSEFVYGPIYQFLSNINADLIFSLVYTASEYVLPIMLVLLAVLAQSYNFKRIKIADNTQKTEISNKYINFVFISEIIVWILVPTSIILFATCGTGASTKFGWMTKAMGFLFVVPSLYVIPTIVNIVENNRTSKNNSLKKRWTASFIMIVLTFVALSVLFIANAR